MMAYRVIPDDGETVIEIEPHPGSGGEPCAYVTLTDDHNPSMAVRLDLSEIAELREAVEKVERSLTERAAS